MDILSGAAKIMLLQFTVIAGCRHEIRDQQLFVVFRHLRTLNGAGAETARQIECVTPATAGAGSNMRAVPAMTL